MIATFNKIENGKKTELVKFVKFSLTGVMNTAVDFGVFALLGWLGLNVYISQVCSYCAGVLNSYVINRSWTFTTKEKFFSSQMLKFIAAGLALLGISVLILELLYGQMGLSKWVSKVCATAVTVTVGFIVNRLWVFK